ncbi:hypothetical protein [uncultured Psychrobacter sp.]|uniref:hypothetical protein n=1 Tax=uncultured Psychrobacter sp. TaxID=259303 RepID=UPI0030D84EAF
MNNDKVNSVAGIAIFGNGLSINTAPQSGKTILAKPKTPLITETALEERIEPFGGTSSLLMKSSLPKPIERCSSYQALMLSGVKR